MKNWLKLIISILLPLSIGASGSLFTETGLGSWYQTIRKPSWNPPDWIFGPVWTTLYILMGIAFFFIWRSGAAMKVKKPAFIFFLIQLVLNFFWSFIFFQQQQIGWALLEILLLWCMILASIISFAKISKPAAWLLVPYISWVSFAAVLNYAIWELN